MKRFEYDISSLPSDRFQKTAVFCSPDGACSLEQVPGDELRILADILQDRGADGWELVQLFFGEKGLLAFWKRERAD
jgi:hypothetical protein